MYNVDADMRIILAAIFILSLLSAQDAFGVGLGELMSLARSQKSAQDTYREETRAFERVKADIDRGLIKKGQSKKEIKDRYGEPVVNTRDSETTRDKWIYKPAKSSFFSGIKAYLYFDKDDKLDEVKIVE